VKRSDRPFPWLALVLLLLSLGAFWGVPRLMPVEQVDVTFEGQTK